MPNWNVLDEHQVHVDLEPLHYWSLKEGKIRGSFVFRDFKKAFAFMTEVAREAESLQHHPEWSNVYNQVTINYWTHDAGDRITDLDIRLATIISQIAKRLGATFENHD